MENKKTIIGIIIVVILIVGIVVGSYIFNDFSTKQLNILTEETNQLLQTDIATQEINFEIKTEKKYAIVEKSMKEYLLKLQNIYKEVEEINTQINPNDIFSAQHIEDKNFEEIDTIIMDYKEKSKTSIEEYEKLVKEENIVNYIEQKDLTNYYKDLYKTAMLSDVMKSQYNLLKDKIEKQKDKLTDRLISLEKIEKFLEDNDKSWTTKDDKIQFTNLNIMTQYYNLLNELVD